MASSAGPPQPRQQRLRRLLQVVLAAMLALHAWAFVALRKNVREGYPDFSIFYTAGECVQRGLGSQLYDLATEKRLQEGFIPPAKIHLGPLPFTHPPFEAPLFVPLVALPYQTAYAVWHAISLALLLGFVLLMRPYLPRLRGWSETLPFLAALAFFPVFLCLFEGQDSLLLLFLFALVYVCMRSGKEFLVGICLGLALFRFQLVLPVVGAALLRRKWRVLAGFTLAALAMGAISLAVVGWGPLWNYPYQLWELSRTQVNGAMNPTYMPNLRGLIYDAAGDHLPARLLTAIVSLGLVGFAAWKWKTDPPHPAFDLSFALMLAVSVMASYHLNGYDMSLLLIPLLLAAEWMLSRSTASTAATRLLLAATGLLFLMPLWQGIRYGALFWTVLLAALSLALSRERKRGVAQAIAVEAE
jgi:hypothetical protein